MVNSIFQTAVVEELSAAYVPEPNARNVDATSVVVTNPTAAQASVLIDLEMFSTEHNKRRGNVCLQIWNQYSILLLILFL